MEPRKPIRIFDVRARGTVQLAAEGAPIARALRDDCLSFFPKHVQACLPLLDGIARRWLTRARTPYLGEIHAIAAALNFPGIWFLNASYQWGCTAIACGDCQQPWLARTLDWPFPGLGRHVTVAYKRGPAGDFFDVTWPGYVGALTAMAPARFAAGINQAPLFRRTGHPWLRPYDFAANALRTWSLRHMPPDQLLRQAFETCHDFAQARHFLETTPIARPVIYTLVGCKADETCTIERTEDGFSSRVQDTVSANDWSEPKPRWEGRLGAHRLFDASQEEARDNSLARRNLLAQFAGQFGAGDFAWVIEPVLNRYTRLAVEMCPARSILRVIGYEQEGADDLPQPVTELCEIHSAEIETARP